MSQSLYDLTSELLAIQGAIESDDGEIPPDLEARLDAVQMGADQKMENIRRFMADLEGQAFTAKMEKDRLALIEQRAKNKAERLKRYLLDTMQRLNLARWDTPLFKNRIQKNPPRVEFVGDLERIPEEFRRVTIAPDLLKAKERYKDGSELPACFVVHQGVHLRLS